MKIMKIHEIHENQDFPRFFVLVQKCFRNIPMHVSGAYSHYKHFQTLSEELQVHHPFFIWVRNFGYHQNFENS